MKKLLLAAAILLLALPLATAPLPAHGAPPKWTILRQVCWKISPTAGQCAVGLYGEFATYGDCLAANGGKLQADAQTSDGRQIGNRCEIKLEGQF